jgi:hypothetical protein
MPQPGAPTVQWSDRDADTHGGALPGRTRDRDGALQRLDSVGQPDEARPAARVGAAHSIVADRQRQGVVEHLPLDAHHSGLRMLGRIRQRFGDDVVGPYLNRLGQSSRNIHIDLGWDRRSSPKSLQRRAQPTF